MRRSGRNRRRVWFVCLALVTCYILAYYPCAYTYNYETKAVPKTVVPSTSCPPPSSPILPEGANSVVDTVWKNIIPPSKAGAPVMFMHLRKRDKNELCLMVTAQQYLIAHPEAFFVLVAEGYSEKDARALFRRYGYVDDQLAVVFTDGGKFSVADQLQLLGQGSVLAALSNSALFVTAAAMFPTLESVFVTDSGTMWEWDKCTVVEGKAPEWYHPDTAALTLVSPGKVLQEGVKPVVVYIDDNPRIQQIGIHLMNALFKTKYVVEFPLGLFATEKLYEADVVIGRSNKPGIVKGRTYVECQAQNATISPKQRTLFADDFKRGIKWSPTLNCTTHEKGLPFVITTSWETWDSEQLLHSYMPHALLGSTRRLDNDLPLGATKARQFAKPGWQKGPPVVWWPLGSRSMYFRGEHPNALEKPATFDARAVLDSKDYFAVFIAKTSFADRYRPDVLVRTAFVQLLREYRWVQSLGFNMNDHDRVGSRRKVEGGDVSGPARVFSYFKFAVVMENGYEEGWFTERLPTAILANTVPIYFGAPDLPDYVNPKRYIHCNFTIEEMETVRNQNVSRQDKGLAVVDWLKENVREPFDKCIDKVKAIDQDNEAYMAMISEPFFKDNNYRNSEFDIRTPASRMRHVMEAYESRLVPQLNAF